MIRLCCFVLMLALAGCGTARVVPSSLQASPCAVEEASYACQVQRYYDVAQ